MTLIDYAISVIGSSITIFLELLSYKKISNNKIKIVNFKNILLLVFYGFLITLNIYTSSPTNRAFINFALLYSLTIIVFKESLSKSLFYNCVVYLIGTIYEIILSIILMITKFNLEAFDTNLLIKSIFSFVIFILVYFTCCNNKLSNYCQKIERKVNKKNVLVIISICLIAFFIVDVTYIMNVNGKLYYTNIVVLICFMVIICIAIYNYMRMEKEIEKTETLLNFMSKYEETIDKDRTNRHEMLNNLLMLKTIENKNSKEYENILDDLIKEYDKSGNSIKNIYKLPTGLKGLFYYKLNSIDNINLNVNISKKIVDISKKISRKDYVVLCKALGILLDNAIEASLKSKDRYIGIEVFDNKDEYTIIVDNSCKDKVNINKINNKNYSTKGKKRGLGLYILNNMLEKNSIISLIQNYNDKIFTSIIKVKLK